jgi:hypothetical protein
MHQHHLFEQVPEEDDSDIPPERSHCGYIPGHCWYWWQGGEPIPVDEIPPSPFKGYDPIHRNWRGKPDPPLQTQLLNAQAALASDTQRYLALLEHAASPCSKYDLMFGYDWRFNCSLKYNHISYDKGLIRLLERAIARCGF